MFLFLGRKETAARSEDFELPCCLLYWNSSSIFTLRNILQHNCFVITALSCNYETKIYKSSSKIDFQSIYIVAALASDPDISRSSLHTCLCRNNHDKRNTHTQWFHNHSCTLPSSGDWSMQPVESVVRQKPPEVPLHTIHRSANNIYIAITWRSPPCQNSSSLSRPSGLIPDLCQSLLLTCSFRNDHNKPNTHSAFSYSQGPS